MTVTITSSIIQWANPQKDGTSNVRELHIDNMGITYTIDYALSSGIDINAHLAASAAQLLISIPAEEIADNIGAVMTQGSLAVPTFNYSTAAQNIAALRAAYKVSTQQQAIFIGDFLSSLTDAQLEAAFGLTLQQTTTLRTNFLTPAATAAAAIRSAVGA